MARRHQAEVAAASVKRRLDREMALTVILVCVAILLPLCSAIVLHGSPLGRILTYGLSLIVSAAGLAVALTHLLGLAPTKL